MVLMFCDAEVWFVLCSFGFCFGCALCEFADLVLLFDVDMFVRRGFLVECWRLGFVLGVRSAVFWINIGV